MTDTLEILRRDIITCRRCPRLVTYRRSVARTGNRRFPDWDYWAKPVPGFGDPGARLMLVGLAPAAHGGNRTGRVFTGDRSGDFLMKCLYRVGLANQTRSESLDDGLKVYGTYITPVLKCVPPDDRPLAAELDNCSHFLARELFLLDNLRCVVALGRVAFHRSFRFWQSRYPLKSKDFPFGHGKVHPLPDGRYLVGCYHPSPRNVNTGRLNERMMTGLLETARRLAGITAISPDPGE
ncbi:MAG: uracil-DNA glycosylase [Fidelibacterota bacterium]